MKKCISQFVLPLLVLCLLFTTTATCEEDLLHYQIAGTEANISMPSNWYYGDRGISDNSRICKRWGITSKEYIEEFLDGDCYMYAFSDNHSVSLTYHESEWLDYVDLKDEDIYRINNYYLSTEGGYKVITSAIVRYDNIPFFKCIVETPSNLVVYSYVTTYHEKEYVFDFFYKGKYIKSNDDLFDSIMSSISFGAKDTVKKEGENDSVSGSQASYKFDDFFMLSRKEYVYKTRSDKNLDYTSQFMFDNDYHVKALISYEGFYTDVASYPREHMTALSDNDCLVEIIEYAGGGFSALTKTITIEKFDDYCYLICGKDDVTEGVNVEYMEVYVFHKNGIVKISTNHTFVNDGERNRCISFLKDLARCVWSPEEMPKE